MPPELIDFANPSALLLALAALLTGGLIAWWWRSIDVRRLELRERELDERGRELDVELASVLSEREQLERQLEEVSSRTRALQAERDRLATGNAALEARQLAEQQKHAEQLALLEKRRQQKS